MTDFREILRLNSLGLSNADVAEAVSCSRNTVSKVLKACSEKKYHVAIAERDKRF